MIQPKFELGQVVWYWVDRHICSAKILSMQITSNLHNDWNHTVEQQVLFTAFGNNGVMYKTVHAFLDEKDVYSSKEELVAAALCEPA